MDQAIVSGDEIPSRIVPESDRWRRL